MAKHTDGGELMTAYGPNGEVVEVTRKAFRAVYQPKGFGSTKAEARVTVDTPRTAPATAPAVRTPAARKATPARGAARKALADKS